MKANKWQDKKLLKVWFEQMHSMPPQEFHLQASIKDPPRGCLTTGACGALFATSDPFHHVKAAWFAAFIKVRVHKEVSMKRSTLRFALLSVIAAAASAVIAGDQVWAEDASVVKISAKRFAYSPSEITLKKGVPVTLQLTTEDRSHGFSVPDWNIRKEIEPGKVIEVQVTPAKAGEVSFFCDIYCGSGHEDMGGTFKVIE
jgi:cytochrome c oxidase subunit 2